MSDHEDQTEPHSTKGDLTVDCVKAIDNYRGENISKWEAVSQISATIQSATASMDIGQRASAGETYLAMFNEHDQSLVDARTQGYQRAEQCTNESTEQEDIFD